MRDADAHAHGTHLGLAPDRKIYRLSGVSMLRRAVMMEDMGRQMVLSGKALGFRRRLTTGKLVPYVCEVNQLREQWINNTDYVIFMHLESRYYAVALLV